MNNWFEIKIRFEKTGENGVAKKVTETYIVDALSFTEAEARTIEEVAPFISGEFKITGIKPIKLSEIFFEETGDKYFKAKIQFITLNDKGEEKKTATYMLAQASNIDQAQEVIHKSMEGSMADYIIAEVKETQILDVWLYNS